MASFIFDTHELIESLTKSGMPEAQAKALSDGLKRIRMEGVATKADVALLREDNATIRDDIASLRSDFDTFKQHCADL